MRKTTKIAVIGAGFAGAATSYFLHEAGLRDHVIFEAEDMPGTRASGLNAAMGRQVISDPEFRKMAIDGVQFLRNPPAGFSEVPLIDHRGSVLCFSPSDHSTAEALFKSAQHDGIACELWDAEKLHTTYPLMRDVDCAIATATDGIIDIHSLLYAYLKPARAAQQLHTSTHITKLVQKNNHWEIHTTQGAWDAEIIVNAAGAWASHIAQLANTETVPLQVRRRHLFVTALTSRVPSDWPFIWDLSHNYYFRPESGSVMISVCDEDITTADDAFESSDAVYQLMEQKLSTFCPTLTDLPIAHRWAGARTFTEDSRPLVRWDAQAKNVLWVAGLGGHGATTSSSIGRIAAQKLSTI